ncbi:hypothetical protein Y032_0140g2165 [Ancylostoma ceylanicum]|uniref:Uncharacterized protein n=1 Tax=Ancylostoma ceylanicum TaxID=53326 RepID=A0A016T4B9_9BILA|nr:hypothetical protein Y032_0140g2165 [Ancylostoma ceylanicum]
MPTVSATSVFARNSAMTFSILMIEVLAITQTGGNAQFILVVKFLLRALPRCPPRLVLKPGPVCFIILFLKEERVRSNSVEIISSTPPAVVDLEQRAERLIITPERRVPKTEAGAEDDARDNGSGSVGVKN